MIMAKNPKRKTEEGPKPKGGWLDSRTYFLAKEWLTKLYLAPWHAHGSGRKRK